MSRADVPGAWYDLSSRLSAAATVIGMIDSCMPCGDRAVPVMTHLNDIGNLATAADELLRLCMVDCERIERAILDRRPVS